MFKTVKPRGRFTGVRVTPGGLRITKDIRAKLTDWVRVRVDTDELELELSPHKDHRISVDGRVSITRDRLQLPTGRYVLDRESNGVLVFKYTS